MDDDQTTNAIMMTVDIVASYVTHNNLRPDDVPRFIAATHAAIMALDDGSKEVVPDEKHEPAVTARRSLASRDHIVSMIDGKSYRSLKRHLTKNGLTPDEYRQRYGLKPEYPMVAPGYSEERRAVAKRLGLGRKPAARVDGEVAEPAAHKRVRGKAAPNAA